MLHFFSVYGRSIGLDLGSLTQFLRKQSHPRKRFFTQPIILELSQIAELK